MANAVEEFKVVSAEKAHKETEEAVLRQKAEAEIQAKAAAEQRKSADAQAKAAQEQANIVELLAEGLVKMAEGELGHRLGEGFTESYRQIKDDFNAMGLRLHDADRRDRAGDARDRQRVERIVGKHHRPVATHRGTGREPRADLGLDGADFRRRCGRTPRTPSAPALPQAARAKSPIAADRWSPRRSTPWRASRIRRARFPTSSASSTRSRGRPICSRSMRRSRPRAPAKRDAALRWSLRKCAASRSAPRRPPRTSRT